MKVTNVHHFARPIKMGIIQILLFVLYHCVLLAVPSVCMLNMDIFSHFHCCHPAPIHCQFLLNKLKYIVEWVFKNAPLVFQNATLVFKRSQCLSNTIIKNPNSSSDPWTPSPTTSHLFFYCTPVIFSLSICTMSPSQSPQEHLTYNSPLFSCLSLSHYMSHLGFHKFINT